MVQGGVPGVSSAWVGNNQIIRWMLNNPGLWEFKPLNQLIKGDFILLTNDPDAVSDWSYIYPAGYSRWGHVVLVVAPNTVSSWNVERLNKSISWYTPGSSFPYSLGVHIKDENTNTGSPTFKGTLTYGNTQLDVPLTGDPANPTASSHTWKLSVLSSHAPIMFDIDRKSGDLTYRLVLTNEAGGILQDTRSTSTGRGILWYTTPANENLYATLYADSGRSGTYNITGWATSIPHIKYEWIWQDSPMHIHRWHNDVGTNATFYFVTERLSGDLEFNWHITQRSNNQTLALGTTHNGNAIAPGTATGEVDFYIDAVTGNGSYRIGLRQGTLPAPYVPQILQPQLNLDGAVGRNFKVELAAGADNGQGNVKFQVQIDNSNSFDSPEYDTGWISESSLTVENNFEPGTYYLRAQQTNDSNVASGFTDPVQFQVNNSAGPGELLLNAGFETAGTSEKRADVWSQKDNSVAKRVCNTETTSVSYEGVCAYRLTGRSGRKSTITQAIHPSGLPGDTLTLSAWVSTKKMGSGGSIRAKIKYTDGTKKTINLTVPSGTTEYTELTESLVLEGVVNNIKVKLLMNGTSGKFTLDNVTLLLTPAGNTINSLISLPASQ